VAFFFREVTTHRIPLGIRFFHPSGVSFLARGTYINQHGRFIRQGAPEFEDGQSDFFVLDTSLSYRLPWRHGFVTVGATNVTDQHFRFQETDLRNPTVEPARFFFTRITLAF
jgi:hypothetical protein